MIVEAGFQADPRVVEFLLTERLVFMKTLLSVYCILFVLLFLMGVFLSHKIAGPLYAFQRELTKVTKGFRSDSLRFRRIDELKFLQSSFNQLNDFINERREKRVANHQLVTEKLSDFLAASKNSREAVKVTNILKELDDFSLVSEKLV
jgi:signal transduction histidine kinase